MATHNDENTPEPHTNEEEIIVLLTEYKNLQNKISSLVMVNDEIMQHLKQALGSVTNEVPLNGVEKS